VLEAPVAAAVEAPRGTPRATPAFDLALATGPVRVAARGAERAVPLPPMAARLRALAPGITLSVLPPGAANEALTRGPADLAPGFARARAAARPGS
jgi:hypothetical protein